MNYTLNLIPDFGIREGSKDVQFETEDIWGSKQHTYSVNVTGEFPKALPIQKTLKMIFICPGIANCEDVYRPENKEAVGSPGTLPQYCQQRENFLAIFWGIYGLDIVRVYW